MRRKVVDGPFLRLPVVAIASRQNPDDTYMEPNPMLQHPIAGHVFMYFVLQFLRSIYSSL